MPGSILVVCLVITAVLAAPASAQTGTTVEGQVYDAGSGAGVASARVTLDGHGTTLTALGGYFRFERVAPDVYALRVDAFGYASESRLVMVDGALTLSVPLDIAPFPLDPLVVEPRLIDVEGRVRDPSRDLDLVDADIIADHVEPTRTGPRGRFTLEGVLARIPLRLQVRAFGYLLLDTTVVPEQDVKYVFELEPDTVVDRLVAAQVDRIEKRASPRRSVLTRPMNRESLLRHAGRRTLADLLEWEYGSGRLRWVECVVIDEKQLLGAWRPESLFHILPEQLERIEFLGVGSKSSMLRIYTREFMREMISRDIDLRTPTIFGWSDHVTVPAACT